MKKNQIKIIKRKDAEALKAMKDLPREGLAVPSITGAEKEKAERSERRKLDSTVMRWISERRESSRIERMAAMQIMVGGTS